MNRPTNSHRSNARLARTIWGNLSKVSLKGLRSLVEDHGLSIVAGDLLLLEGRWYVTHGGLVRLARREHCFAIESTLVSDVSDPAAGRWVFMATVFKSASSGGFIGFGDADPTNVSSVVRGAEMRVAETRAVNRALRKAYGIGLCSVEEIGSSKLPQPLPGSVPEEKHHNSNGSNHQPRLRDQLSVLIRRHNLDPILVKAYAANFCGTQTLGGASRDLVESFISHLTLSAEKNREALICKLNSFSRPQELGS